MGRRVGRVSVALITWLALACGDGETTAAQSPPGPATTTASREAPPSTPPAEDPAAAADEALNIFATRCFTCHGPEGEGDGPGAAALTPKPRNFQDSTWQASVSDEHIEMIIQYGGAAVGKSPTMPGNPDLTSKPEVVVALREHIRSLASP